jgi:perosamine synthetase
MIPVYRPLIGEAEKRNVLEAVESTWISSKGVFLDRFETGFAGFVGAKHGVGTCNGTVSIHLALVALGIGPGDEVIVPTFTYVASVNAITYTGATPVFVDSEMDTWNLDPALIEARITPRTRAIMVVHLYGHPADMDPIMDIARRHGVAVVEDAAEAHGAECRGRKVGSIGDISSLASSATRSSPPARGAWSSPTTMLSLSAVGTFGDRASRRRGRTGTTSWASTTA